MDKFTAVANLANFLMEQKGSVLATWKGKMTANQQRELFGCFIGKGEITINGEKEIIKHTVKVGFGGDYEVTFEQRWADVSSKQEEVVL